MGVGAIAAHVAAKTPRRSESRRNGGDALMPKSEVIVTGHQ
jgi:hypothetical protein